MDSIFERIVAVVLGALGAILTVIGVACLYGALTGDSSAGLQNPNDETPEEVFLAIGSPALVLGLFWIGGSWAILRGLRGGYYGYLAIGVAASLISSFLIVSYGPDSLAYSLFLTGPILLCALLAIQRSRGSKDDPRGSL